MINKKKEKQKRDYLGATAAGTGSAFLAAQGVRSGLPRALGVRLEQHGTSRKAKKQILETEKIDPVTGEKVKGWLDPNYGGTGEGLTKKLRLPQEYIDRSKKYTFISGVNSSHPGWKERNWLSPLGDVLTRRLQVGGYQGIHSGAITNDMINTSVKGMAGLAGGVMGLARRLTEGSAIEEITKIIKELEGKSREDILAFLNKAVHSTDTPVFKDVPGSKTSKLIDKIAKGQLIEEELTSFAGKLLKTNRLTNKLKRNNSRVVGESIRESLQTNQRLMGALTSNDGTNPFLVRKIKALQKRISGKRLKKDGTKLNNNIDNIRDNLRQVYEVAENRTISEEEFSKGRYKKITEDFLYKSSPRKNTKSYLINKDKLSEILPDINGAIEVSEVGNLVSIHDNDIQDYVLSRNDDASVIEIKKKLKTIYKQMKEAGAVSRPALMVLSGGTSSPYFLLPPEVRYSLSSRTDLLEKLRESMDQYKKNIFTLEELRRGQEYLKKKGIKTAWSYKLPTSSIAGNIGEFVPGVGVGSRVYIPGTDEFFNDLDRFKYDRDDLFNLNPTTYPKYIREYDKLGIGGAALKSKQPLRAFGNRFSATKYLLEKEGKGNILKGALSLIGKNKGRALAGTGILGVGLGGATLLGKMAYDKLNPKEKTEVKGFFRSGKWVKGHTRDLLTTKERLAGVKINKKGEKEQNYKLAVLDTASNPAKVVTAATGGAMMGSVLGLYAGLLTKNKTTALKNIGRGAKLGAVVGGALQIAGLGKQLEQRREKIIRTGKKERLNIGDAVQALVNPISTGSGIVGAAYGLTRGNAGLYGALGVGLATAANLGLAKAEKDRQNNFATKYTNPPNLQKDVAQRLYEMQQAEKAKQKKLKKQPI